MVRAALDGHDDFFQKRKSRMKWNGVLVNWLGLAALVLCCQAGVADEKKSERLTPPVVESGGTPLPPHHRGSCVPAPAKPHGHPLPGDKQTCPGALDNKCAELLGALFGMATDSIRANARADQEQVEELINILNTTKSPNTLAATAVALVPVGEPAKKAVPAILRNAERLKVLESLGNPESRKGSVASMLLEAIYAIQSGGEVGTFVSREGPPLLPPPPPPPCYGYPPAPASMCPPAMAPTPNPLVCPCPPGTAPCQPVPPPRSY